MQILRLKIRCASVSFKSETQSYNWTLNGRLGANRPEKMQLLYADRLLNSRNKNPITTSKPSEAATTGNAPIPLAIDANNLCAATFYAAQSRPNQRRLKIYVMF